MAAWALEDELVFTKKRKKTFLAEDGSCENVVQNSPSYLGNSKMFSVC